MRLLDFPFLLKLARNENSIAKCSQITNRGNERREIIFLSLYIIQFLHNRGLI